MNAPAQAAPERTLRIEPSPRAEHISLEAAPDISAAPARPPHRKVQSTFTLKCALRGCSTEVSILDDHYLSVRSERLRMPVRKYVFDLRFVNPKPIRVRHIAGYWIAASVLLLAAAAGSIGVAAASSANGSLPIAGAACAAAAAVTVFFSVRRTTESLQFVSVHGGAALLSILGGIGSAKAGKRFFIDLIKNIHAAKLARPQPEQHFLRDEMREHHRLRELHVLSEAEYEASKARILKAHA